MKSSTKRKESEVTQEVNEVFYTLLKEILSDKMKLESRQEHREEASMLFVSKSVIWHFEFIFCRIKLQIGKMVKQHFVDILCVASCIFSVELLQKQSDLCPILVLGQNWKIVKVSCFEYKRRTIFTTDKKFVAVISWWEWN